MSSQRGTIQLLVEDDGNADLICFKSFKSRPVTRPVLSAEVIAFSGLFDEGYALKSLIEHALKCSVPMHPLTDSKSLFDMISKGYRSSEKRIMLYINASRKHTKPKKYSILGLFAQALTSLMD